jgi:hypothetical protein
MKLIPWNEWLDKHIPYYEAERHRNRYLDNPPEVVLIVYPYDDIRNHQVESRTARRWEDHDTIREKLESDPKIKMAAIFLERDTRQEWYWVFWNKNEALLSMMKLV